MTGTNAEREKLKQSDRSHQTSQMLRCSPSATRRRQQRAPLGRRLPGSGPGAPPPFRAVPAPRRPPAPALSAHPGRQQPVLTGQQAPSPFRAEAPPGLGRQTAALSGAVSLGALPRRLPQAEARRGARGNPHGTGGENAPRPAAAANTAPGRPVSKSTKTARPGRQHGRPKDYSSRHAAGRSLSRDGAAGTPAPRPPPPPPEAPPSPESSSAPGRAALAPLPESGGGDWTRVLNSNK